MNNNCNSQKLKSHDIQQAQDDQSITVPKKEASSTWYDIPYEKYSSHLRLFGTTARMKLCPPLCRPEFLKTLFL